jgi:patatin-like phospholipase/acyl hydrolase
MAPQQLKHIRILSLDGGGYLGLATTAFLQEIERHFGSLCCDQFDLFCGTSTGAIIALALAAGLSAQRVTEMYQDFGPKVFRNPVPGVRTLRCLSGLFFSRYSNAALRQSLSQVFQDLTLGDLRKRGKFVLIPAFSVSTGTPRIFKTDHSPDLTRDDGYLLRDVALASSAAPVYLPIVSVQSPTHNSEEQYCDGGVFANHPALLGYAEAVHHLQAKPERIRLLSLSTPRSDLAEHQSATSWLQRKLLRRGLFLWVTRLSSILIDSTSEIDHQTLRRLTSDINGERTGVLYERFVFRKPRGVDLDTASPEATGTLRTLGYQEAVQAINRRRLEQFFRRENNG